MCGFIKEEFWPIVASALVAILGALAGYAALRVKKMLARHEQSLVKRRAVEVCVKAAEQAYGKLSGASRKTKAEQGARELLRAQGVEITPFELDVLIEACVKELNCGLFGGEKKPGDHVSKK
jgi:hypothetical protein